MNEREERWMAYYLDELEPDERAVVEAELKASPDEAAAYRQFVEAVADWATEPIPCEPLSAADIRETVSARQACHPSPPSRRLAWACGLAAAVLVVMGVVLAGGSVTVGGATVSWGPQRAGESEQLAAVAQQLHALEQLIAENRGQIQAVGIQNAALANEFRYATAQLAREQRIETQTRYRDVKQVAQLVGWEYGDTADWLESHAAGPIQDEEN